MCSLKNWTTRRGVWKEKATHIIVKPFERLATRAGFPFASAIRWLNSSTSRPKLIRQVMVVSKPIINASIPSVARARVTTPLEFIFEMKGGAAGKMSARDATHERTKKRMLMIRDER